MNQVSFSQRYFAPIVISTGLGAGGVGILVGSQFGSNGSNNNPPPTVQKEPPIQKKIIIEGKREDWEEKNAKLRATIADLDLENSTLVRENTTLMGSLRRAQRQKLQVAGQLHLLEEAKPKVEEPNDRARELHRLKVINNILEPSSIGLMRKEAGIARDLPSSGFMFTDLNGKRYILGKLPSKDCVNKDLKIRFSNGLKKQQEEIPFSEASSGKIQWLTESIFVVPISNELGLKSPKDAGLRFEDIRDLEITGEGVLGMGNVIGFPTAVTGIVSNNFRWLKDEKDEEATQVQYQLAPFHPSAEGTGIVNIRGNLMGIVVGSYVTDEGKLTSISFGMGLLTLKTKIQKLGIPVMKKAEVNFLEENGIIVPESKIERAKAQEQSRLDLEREMRKLRDVRELIPSHKWDNWISFQKAALKH